MPKPMSMNAKAMKEPMILKSVGGVPNPLAVQSEMSTVSPMNPNIEKKRRKKMGGRFCIGGLFADLIKDCLGLLDESITKYCRLLSERPSGPNKSGRFDRPPFLLATSHLSQRPWFPHRTAHQVGGFRIVPKLLAFRIPLQWPTKSNR